MTNQEKELYQAAVLTFEQLGFMYPTPEMEKEHADADIQAAAAVRFTGPTCGALVVMVTGDVLPSLAANMLGEDSAPPETQQRDALGEIANVICGNALPQIAGSRQVFHIMAPQVVTCAIPPEWMNSAHAVRTSVPFDEGRADLLFVIDNPRESASAA